MTDHLPECIHPQRDYPCAWCQEIDCECPCICDRLRACEQRVNGHRLSYENGVEVGYNKGYVAGLDAAREAVEEVPQWYSDSTKGDDGSFAAECLVEDVLAAIDALREEQK